MKRFTAGAMVAIAALALMVISPWAALTGRGSSHNRIDHQFITWTTQPATTSSTTFVQVPGLTEELSAQLVGKEAVSATVSVDVTGAPVDFRVIEGDRVLRPGFAHFDPAGGTTSFSYTFVSRQDLRQETCRHFKLQWRSSNGETVTLNRGDVVFTYNLDARRGDERFGCD